MALTPFDDMVRLKEILSNDLEIQKFGFNEKNIWLADESDAEVLGDTQYLFIVSYPGPTSPDGLFATIIYGIEAITQKKDVGAALKASERIVELFWNDVDIGNCHNVNIYTPPEQLSAPQGFVRYGTSLKTQAAIQPFLKSEKVTIPP